MRIAGLLLALVVMIQSAIAAEPSTERATEKAVRFTRALEKDPLSEHAPEMRKWLIAWIEETPDFTITICDILGPIPSQNLSYGPELLVQQLFGNVTYQIENSGLKDETLFQLAGVESVLRAYEAILVKDPKGHIKFFDELLEKQRQGVLKDQMAPVIAKVCANEHAA